MNDPSQLKELIEFLDAKDDQIAVLLDEVELLRELNKDLLEQLAVAKRVFGEAFVKGQLEAETGPSRPNRKKLSAQDVKDIRQAFQGGMSQSDLAKNYGVNPATISRTVRRIYH